MLFTLGKATKLFCLVEDEYKEGAFSAEVVRIVPFILSSVAGARASSSRACTYWMLYSNPTLIFSCSYPAFQPRKKTSKGVRYCY